MSEKMTYTTEDMLEEVEEKAIVDIRMTDSGVEFRNSFDELIFTIPLAKGDE